MKVAKDKGVTWKEDSHTGINWMRASVAIQNFMKSGAGILEESKEGVKQPDKDGTIDPVIGRFRELQEKGITSIDDAIVLGRIVTDEINKGRQRLADALKDVSEKYDTSRTNVVNLDMLLSKVRVEYVDKIQELLRGTELSLFEALRSQDFLEKYKEELSSWTEKTETLSKELVSAKEVRSKLRDEKAKIQKELQGPYADCIQNINNVLYSSTKQNGLGIKTYQSDIFNKWLLS